MSEPLVITIDMDKKCVECRKPGALASGICTKCAMKAMGDKPMKSEIGRAMHKRWQAMRKEWQAKP